MRPSLLSIWTIGKGVDTILRKAEVPAVPRADVAVLVGTEFDVFRGRGGGGQPQRKTPWGEIAWQLGGEKAFSAVSEHDAKGTAPAGDALRAMLPSGPTLILMDELLNCVSRGRNLGLRDQLFNFLENLSEESRARNNMVLCVSIPAFELEMTPEDQRDHDALKKLLDRSGKAIMMSADTEIAEIIRRRLFEWYGLPDDARKTASAYAEWAVDHAQELTGNAPERSNDVPNRPLLTLVVMGLDCAAGEKRTDQLMETIVRDCGSSGRTYKSALIFAVPDASETIQEATRDLLAWEAIDEDTETKGRLDEAQKRLLARNFGRAKSDLKEAVCVGRKTCLTPWLSAGNGVRPVNT